MDMLRFDQFTAGKLWVGEYGDPSQEADFRNLFKYSPYHNIQSGKAYPAILATTADADDRVVPGHSFKYVAALQAADIGSKPHLVRIETRGQAHRQDHRRNSGYVGFCRSLDGVGCEASEMIADDL
jgi:prolyl oligopeptidase